MHSFFLSAIIGLELSGNEHLLKAVTYTYFEGKTGPTITDLDKFEYREIEASNEKALEFSEDYNNYEIDDELLESIESYDPIALAILKDGQLKFEKYWDGFSEESKTNPFSVSKSIVALGLLKCIDLNLIIDLDQKVKDFIPELEGPFADAVSIRHLLSMTSGIDFNESYGDPFGFMAQAYYGDELMKKTFSYRAVTEPGTEWNYLGGNTILMSEII